MHDINHLPPERMTPQQRRHEIASLLARALVRLRSGKPRQSANMAAENEFDLGFTGNQRVHSDPVNNRKTEPR